MARWSVGVIRKKGEELGVVTAPDERRAMEKAFEFFGIPPERRNRVVVTKISEKDD